MDNQSEMLTERLSCSETIERIKSLLGFKHDRDASKALNYASVSAISSMRSRGAVRIDIVVVTAVRVGCKIGHLLYDLPLQRVYEPVPDFSISDDLEIRPIIDRAMVLAGAKTMKELAGRIGMSSPTLSTCLKHHRIPYKMLEALACSDLGGDIDWLHLLTGSHSIKLDQAEFKPEPDPGVLHDPAASIIHVIAQLSTVMADSKISNESRNKIAHCVSELANVTTFIK